MKPKNKNIPKPTPPKKNSIKSPILPSNEDYCNFNFRYFKSNCINESFFNNHYKDSNHYLAVMNSFLGTVLPSISNLKRSELVSGGRFTEQFHFHRIQNDKYKQIRTILEAYSFNHQIIDQLLDGESIFQFVGNLQGNSTESRVICEYINGVLCVLFFDTNHHLYFNNSKAGQSPSFPYCPFRERNDCHYAFNCFARDYLDIEKINTSYDYSFPE